MVLRGIYTLKDDMPPQERGNIFTFILNVLKIWAEISHSQTELLPRLPKYYTSIGLLSRIHLTK